MVTVYFIWIIWFRLKRKRYPIQIQKIPNIRPDWTPKSGPCTPVGCIANSDARLFCKNKQVNLKNKPKIGNVTEKQDQHAFGKKIRQNKKSAGKLNRKTGRNIQKSKPKMSIFSEKNAQIAFSSKLKQ